MGHAGGKYGEIDKENCGKIVNYGFILTNAIVYTSFQYYPILETPKEEIPTGTCIYVCLKIVW